MAVETSAIVPLDETMMTVDPEGGAVTAGDEEGAEVEGISEGTVELSWTMASRVSVTTGLGSPSLTIGGA